jgi:hypothetical protein
MDPEPDSSTDRQEVTRDSTLDDIAGLCRELNARGGMYVLVGGFAIMLNGYARHTADVDLLIEVGVANESKVLDALQRLPDRAADSLTPGEVDT